MTVKRRAGTNERVFNEIVFTFFVNSLVGLYTLQSVYSWIPIPRSLDNSNLPLTRSKFVFPSGRFLTNFTLDNSNLAITRTFFDSPWKFELSGFNCSINHLYVQLQKENKTDSVLQLEPCYPYVVLAYSELMFLTRFFRGKRCKIYYLDDLECFWFNSSKVIATLHVNVIISVWEITTCLRNPFHQVIDKA